MTATCSRPIPTNQPTIISERNVNGQVTIRDSHGLPVVYTTDGAMPTAQSPVYQSPIALPRGGTVSAVSVAPNGQIGMMASKSFPGYAPTGWKVVAVDGREPRIGGFCYLPRQDQKLTGVVQAYRFETNEGYFANIKNNPVVQEVPFVPVTARFFRFTALKEVNGNNATSAAEISVLPAEPGGDSDR